MFIGNILKKMSKSSQKRTIIREVISRLRLESDQEQLYLDSLDVLDDEHLEMFYRKLVALVEIIEDREIVTIGNKQNSRLSHIQLLEEEEGKNTKQEVGNFNILFDNI